MSVRHQRAVELALTLYVPRLDSDHQMMAQNLQETIEHQLGNRQTFALTIIDVSKEPDTAREQVIYATPTLVRTSPAPERRIVGDLCKSREILGELIHPHEQ